MSIIIVKDMNDHRLGSGTGEIEPRKESATILEWIDKAALQVGKSYKLESQGKTWIATCETNHLPVRFKLDLRAAAIEANASVNYTLQFRNNSTNPGNIIVFQQDPDLGVPNVFPLAWFSKYTYPLTNAEFTWAIDYNFVWEETGPLVPGVVFKATQDPPANLTTSNQITLEYDAGNGAYYFADQGPGPRPGNLYIRESASVPLKQASVGIGMSGAGTFAVQAQPNLSLTFTPHPRYYVAFGTFTKGEVLDIQEITNAAEVAYPAGVYHMMVVLNDDHTWSIFPAKAVNEAVAIARQNRPQLFTEQRRLAGGAAAASAHGDASHATGTAQPRGTNGVAGDGKTQDVSQLHGA